MNTPFTTTTAASTGSTSTSMCFGFFIPFKCCTRIWTNAFYKFFKNQVLLSFSFWICDRRNVRTKVSTQRKGRKKEGIGIQNMFLFSKFIGINIPTIPIVQLKSVNSNIEGPCECHSHLKHTPSSNTNEMELRTNIITKARALWNVLRVRCFNETRGEKYFHSKI